MAGAIRLGDWQILRKAQTFEARLGPAVISLERENESDFRIRHGVPGFIAHPTADAHRSLQLQREFAWYWPDRVVAKHDVFLHMPIRQRAEVKASKFARGHGNVTNPRSTGRELTHLKVVPESCEYFCAGNALPGFGAHYVKSQCRHAQRI